MHEVKLENIDVIQRFQKIHEKKLLGHAYLLAGPQGIGKVSTAIALAKLVNCESGENSNDAYCDRCSACIQINAGHHPDVHLVEASDNETIKIEQVREMLSTIQFRPFQARYKVFILKNIEKMSLEGSNALLKTLEEPNRQSLLLLTTSVPELILGTIRSRCQIIHLFPDSSEHLAEELMKQFNIELHDARFIAYIAEGSWGQAVRLTDSDFIRRVRRIIEDFILGRDQETIIKEALSDKEMMKEMLKITLSWMRDCMLYQCGIKDQRLVHINLMEEVDGFQKNFSFEELNEIYCHVIQVLKHVHENFNVKIPMMLLKEKLNYG